MIIENFRIELTAFDGTLFHSSMVNARNVLDVQSIVYADRHFVYTTLKISPFRVTLHFHEVTPPTKLIDMVVPERPK